MKRKRIHRGITIILIVTLLAEYTVQPDGLPFQARKASAKTKQNTETPSVLKSLPATGTEEKGAVTNSPGAGIAHRLTENLSSKKFLSKALSSKGNFLSGKIDSQNVKNSSLARPNALESGVNALAGETKKAVKANTLAAQTGESGGITDTSVQDGKNIPLTETDASGDGTDGFPETEAGLEAIDTQAPTIPERLAITERTDRTVTISWLLSTDNAGVSGYEVYSDSVKIGTGKETTYTVTDLSPGETYSFTVTAKDSAGNKSAESEPLEVSMDSGDDTYHSGDGISGTADEAIESERSKTESAEVAAGPIGEAAGLSDGETYAAVEATDAADEAADAVYGTRDTADGITDTTNDNTDVSDDVTVPADGIADAANDNTDVSNDVTAPADGVTDATNDMPDVSGAANPAEEAAAPTEDTADTIDNVTDTDREVSGNPENPSTADTPDPGEKAADLTQADDQAPTAPGNLTAAVVSGPAIHLTWEASADDAGIDKYEVYCNGELAGSTTTEEYTYSGPEPGVLYRFYVTARDTAGNVSEPSNTVNVTADDDQAPGAPENLTAAATGSAITLTWEPSTDNVGVTGYDIFQDNVWIDSTTGANTYTVTGLTRGVEYSFTVKARDGAGNISQASNAVTVTLEWDRPDIREVTAGEEGITVHWTEVPDAAGYELSINGEVIEAGKVTTYVQTQVLPNYKYVYQVRFIKGTEKSAWSDAWELLTAPDQVLNLAAVVINESAIELTWDAVEGAKAYEIEVNGAIVGTAGENNYRDSNSEGAANLIYRVRTVNGELKGKWSDPVSIVSQTIIKGGTITEDTVWDSAKGIYIVQGNVTVAQGVTLEVMPGTIVKFKSATGMTINGGLIAEGAQEKPIVFTSTEDTEYGGSGIDSSSDYWKGIFVGSTGEFTGDYVKIKYGGYLSSIDYNESTIKVEGKLALNHSEVIYSRQDGILLRSGEEVSIENTVIDGSRECGIEIDKNVNTGKIKISNNIIRNSSDNGIYLYHVGDGGLTIEKNTMEGNINYPIYIKLEGLTSSTALPGIASDNVFQGNQMSDSILIIGELLVDTTLTENRYTVEWVTVSAGKTLVIQPGSVLMGYQDEGAIEIEGKLTAQGTEEQPVVFTSTADTAYGGSGIDSSGDYWYGIYVGSTGEFTGDYVKIKYGGYYFFGFDPDSCNKSAINIEGKLALNHSEVTGSYQDGILIQSGENASLENTIVDASKENGIKINKTSDTGSILIKNNIISNSTEYGIYVYHAVGMEFTIEKNTVISNGSYPICLDLSGILSSEVPRGISSDNIFNGNAEANDILLRGGVGEDLTLGVNRYILSWISVDSGKTLTIQPGTILLGMRSYGCIDLKGKIIARGTADNPVLFTSIQDPEYGGNGIASVADNWRGINIYNTGEFIGDNIEIRNAGYKYYGDELGSLTVEGSLTLSNSEIISYYKDGIFIDSGNDVTIQNSTIDGSKSYNIRISKSDFSTGTVTIKNNRIQNGSGYGIYVYESGSSGLIVENNVIENNAREGVYIRQHGGGILSLSANTIRNNGGHPVGVILSSFEGNLEIAPDNVYQGNLSSDHIYIEGTLSADIKFAKNTYIMGDIIIPAGKTLTMDPGTVILSPDDGYINVKGKLLLLGSEENPVVMTSSYDPAYGGSGVDSSGNYWGGIRVQTAGELEAYYLKIKYGVTDIRALGKITVINSEITDAYQYGIYLNTTVQPTLLTNSFQGNSYAVYNGNSGTVMDASYNYWNSLYGPSVYVNVYEPATNKWTWQWAGSGDRVGSNVSYKPYLGSEMTVALHFSQTQGAYAPTGNYSKQFSDMKVGSVDGSIEFTRAYNSQDTDTDSILGEGWSFSYDCGITDYKDYRDIKMVKLPDGSQESYTVNGDGTYTSNNTRNTLEKQENGTYLLTTKEQVKYGFHSDGKLVFIESREGNRLTITLGSDGLPRTLTDYAGRQYRFTYENNRLTTITDPSGRTVTYDYDGGKLVKVIDPEAIETTYQYEENGKLSEIQDGNSDLVEAVTYQVENGVTKVASLQDPYGNEKTYAYDELNSKTTITDSNGYTTIQSYDSAYSITNQTDAEGRTAYAAYFTDDGRNQYGEVKSTSDRNGNVTVYERDGRGNITKITNPDGSDKQYTYDEKNNVTSEREEAGKYTYYVYDSTRTDLLKTVQPLNGTDGYSETADPSKFAITAYTYYGEGENDYSIKGLIRSVTDPEGNLTTYTYDAYGNPITQTDSLGNTTASTYNGMGLKTGTLSAKGELTTYTYTKNGNPETVVLAGGETTRIRYDALGRKIQEIPANLSQTAPEEDAGYRYTYDHSGKIRTMTDPEDHTTAYTYDLYGNRLTETNPDGGIYSYEYDALNRVTRESFQESANAEKELLKTYAYTILSDKKTQTAETVYLNETETAVTAYVYDYADRQVKQTNPDGGVLSTGYNTNGTVSTQTDARGKTTYYRYDGLNRLTEQWTPFGDGKYTYQRVTYDKNGNQTAEKTGVQAVSLWSVPTTLLTTASAYDGNNRLISVTDSAGGRTDYEYDENGTVSKETVYLDLEKTKVTAYINNYLGKPETVIQQVQAGDIEGNAADDTTDFTLLTTYTYDADGNVKTMTTPDQITTTYGYDKRDRQVTQSVPGLDEYGNQTVTATGTTYDYAGNILTATDGKGNVTRNGYNKKGLLEKTIDPEGGVTAYYYDRAGRMTAKVLPENYREGAALSDMTRLVFTYDAGNRVILEQDIYYDETAGTWKTIHSKANRYDFNGNVLKTLDALGYDSGTGATLTEKINSGYGTTHTYNDANLLITTLSPESEDNGLSFDTKYAYDAAGRKISETNANSVVTQYQYDDAGRLTKTTVTGTTDQVIQQATYDGMGNVLTQTDGNGNTTTDTYNRLGLLKDKTTPGDATIDPDTIRNQYNLLGQLVYQKDSLGRTNRFTYDHNGKVLTETEEKEDGTQRITTAKVYDKNGNLRFETDANGATTEYGYDALNRVTYTRQTVDGAARDTTNTYDKNGSQLTVTDWLGNTYTNEYDALNRLIQKTDPSGVVIEKYEYNNNHAQIKAYDALDQVTEYAYDKNSRLIRTTDPSGHVTAQTYDKAGNLATKTDGSGNVTAYGYDALNRLAKVTNAKNEVTGYTYDGNGNLLTQTEGKGNTVTYSYNAANQVLRKAEPKDAAGVSQAESYTYYADKTVKTKTDRNGNTTAYTYDIHGNLISETAGNNLITYTYDGNGNLLTLTDATGKTARTYDELGRVLTKTVPQVGTVSFEYDNTADADPGCYREITTDPKGNVTVKVYEKAGRLSQVIVGNDSTTYTYYENGNRKEVVYNDGSKEEYTYYANNQVKSLRNKRADGSLMDSYTYTYDHAGNQLTKHEVINGVEKGTTAYTYDTLNRLFTVTEPQGRVTAYEYDKAGNRSKETITIADSTSGSTITTENTYTYNNQNRLTDLTAKVNNILTGVTTYTYDKNGNQLTTVVKTYTDGAVTSTVTTETNTYDGHNQLIKTVIEDGTVVNNTYNGEGYRVKKEGNGEKTYYLYEGDQIILEVDEEGKQIARNVYGTNLILRTVEGETYYYLYNGHADVTALITRDGAVAATYYYDAFGNILESTGEVNNNIRYSGYQYDEETGLYYLNSRMYDPKTARFLQEDTYTGEANDPLSLNRYTYCSNNPIIYWDPTGHSWKDIENFFKAAAGKVGKTAKAAGRRVKAVGKGAVNIAEGMLAPTADWMTYGYAWAHDKVGGAFNKLGMDHDTQFYQSLKEVAWEKIEDFSDQPNTLTPVANLFAMKIGESYLKAIGEDQQVIDNYNAITWEDVTSSVPGAVDSFFQPFRTVFNKENAYNFFLNPNATDEQLEEYATNGIAAGLTVYGLGKGTQTIASRISITNTIKPFVNANGTLQLATVSAPSISITAGGGLLGNLAYSAAGSSYNSASKEGFDSANKPYSNLKDSKRVGKGKAFTQSQKEKIIQENMNKNNGVIKSDVSGEALVPATKSTAGVTPNPLEAQIDHIYPKSKGGTNSFSNAQVLSRRDNIIKSNK